MEILGQLMTWLPLTKVMRYTNGIASLSKHIQNDLGNNGNLYFHPCIKTEKEVKESTVDEQPSRDNAIKHVQPSYATSLDAIENTNSLDTTDGTIIIPDNAAYLEHISFDRLMKYLQYDQKQTFDKKLAIKTDFRFYTSKGCGHRITGSRPSIVRFEDMENAENVAKAIAELARPMWKKSLFICNNLTIAELTLNALNALEINVVEYLDGLKDRISTDSRKYDVYNSWMNKGSCVLLTDNRGCRGLQHEQVMLI